MANLNFFSQKKHKNEILKAPLLKRLIRQNCRNFKVGISKAKGKKFILNLRSINFDLITIFYTVVLLGSIKLAAESLGVSQPAITLSLQKIEREIGCLLFKHSHYNKSLKLTRPGVIIFNYFDRSFQIIEGTSKLLTFLDYEDKQKTINFLDKTKITPIISTYKYNSYKNIPSLNSIKTFRGFSFYSFYKFVTTKHFLNLQKKPKFLCSIFFKIKVKKSFRSLSKSQKSYKTNGYYSTISSIKSTEIYTKRGFHIASKLKISDFFCLNT